MDIVSTDPAVQKASQILSWTSIAERECLARLAREVPAGGSIVEIGSLYGGAAAAMALANPKADVLCIDEFSWTPEGHPAPSERMLLDNMKLVGAPNVRCIPTASEKIAPIWDRPIDLLWVDGGHTYEYVYCDLCMFGSHATVIAAHDYGNPAWGSIMRAVTDFLSAMTEPPMVIAEVVDMVVVLRAA